jgi:hypothetical protein
VKAARSRHPVLDLINSSESVQVLRRKMDSGARRAPGDDGFMFKRLLKVVAGAALITFMAAVTALAHHSFAAEFDAKRPVKLRGTVVKMEWINPHSWIHMDVKDPVTGKVERWMIEGGAPNALLRRGWTKNSLPEGTEILVEGFQAKDGANRANGRDITFPDGRKLFVGSSGTGAPDERPEK